MRNQIIADLARAKAEFQRRTLLAILTQKPPSQMQARGRRMLIHEECPHCKGVGLQHSPNRNGDPMDPGVPCHVCDGTGVVDADPADEIEDWMEDDQ